ncbi:MAG: tyrosine-protein phosphatase [Christensenellales bacterium]|jgi:protein-tyrosine phosphatase
MESIVLKNPANFRDLGGIRTSEGMCVKPNRLLRSGELTNLTEPEKSLLTDRFGVQTVVDFRVGSETKIKPDAELSGARNIHIDIMKNAERQAGIFANYQSICSSEQAHAFMVLFYELMITDEAALCGYRQFLELVMQQRQGALLFHCFAGKDRTGVAAAMVLTLLGVEREVILDDYLLTNTLRRKPNLKMMEYERSCGKTEEEIAVLNEFLLVKEDYLQRVFAVAQEASGSFLQHLRRIFDISDDDIAALKKNYLQPIDG